MFSIWICEDGVQGFADRLDMRGRQVRERVRDDSEAWPEHSLW